MTMTRYNQARNPNGLSLGEVKASAPSAFATKASPKRSDRYAFVSTIDTIKPLIEAGWMVTGASQRSTRLDGRDPRYTRHMLNLAPPNADKVLVKVGDVRPELTLINAHDGQARFVGYLGMVRLACLNGLVVGGGRFASVSFKHIGDPKGLVDQASELAGRAKELGPIIAEMNRRTMDDKAAKLFAAKAAKLAYDRQDFDPSVLLATRREADAGRTVWQVFNRVQENIVRGGVQLTHKDGKRKQTTTRGLSHLQRTVDFNVGLWDLAVASIEKKAA